MLINRKHIPYFIVVVFLVFIITSCSKPYSKKEGFVSFAKAFGYVKYFHPSDEASKIDWNQFAVYGAQEISKCSSKKELISCLNRIFKPIAPSVKFADVAINNPENQFKSFKSDSAYRQTFWQHNSLELKNRRNHSSYKSKRYNRLKNDTLLFDRILKYGEATTSELVTGVFCYIPLVLYCNDDSTYPTTDEQDFVQLTKQINELSQDAKDLEVRIANVIIVYSTIKHFYPYFDELKDLNWEEKLDIALNQSLKDTSINMHCKTVAEFTAHLKDGHIGTGYFNIENQIYGYPPIHIGYVENKFIVTSLLDNSLNVKIGDQVTHIDNIPIQDYFNERKKSVSGSTKQNQIYKTGLKLLNGKYDSKVTLKIEGKDIPLRRIFANNGPTSILPKHYQIDSTIHYVNLNKIEMDSLTMLLPSLTKAESIIFDLRFYPNRNSDILKHLISEKINTKWMRISEITYPDQRQPITYNESGWPLEPSSPSLSDKNIIFLGDVSGQSYTESVLGYVKSYGLGTIVGQPTAGINGNVIYYSLVGQSYTGVFTGMKAVNHDQSQFFGNGILPDVYVNKTVKGIKENRDEYLEKAIELAKKEIL